MLFTFVILSNVIGWTILCSVLHSMISLVIYRLSVSVSVVLRWANEALHGVATVGLQEVSDRVLCFPSQLEAFVHVVHAVTATCIST